MAALEKLVAVGQVIKPHGIKGELCVESHASSPSLFAKGRTLWLKLPGQREQAYTVAASRPHQGRLLLSFEGVADRNLAETLRQAEVLVRPQDLPPLDEGEVYLHELFGFDVVLEGGRKVGVLEGLLDAPGQDVWIIRSPAGREILFPATEETVPEIDLEARSIRINPPEGLLALYE